MNNHIKIYQNNTQTIAVYVSGLEDLSLYEPWLTVKKRAIDDEILLSKLGLVSDPSTTYVFNLETVDTSMAPKDYVYDVTLISPVLGNHTVVRDVFTIQKTIKDLSQI